MTSLFSSSKRLRLVVFGFVGFLITAGLSAMVLDIVTAEATDYCENGVNWRAYLQPRKICTAFAYGNGPILDDSLDFMRKRKIFQLPIYQNSPISGFLTVFSRTQVPGQPSGQGILTVIQASSSASPGALESWYRQHISSDFGPTRQLDLETAQEDWFHYLELPPRANAPGYFDRTPQDSQGVAFWNAADASQVQITLFETKKTK